MQYYLPFKLENKIEERIKRYRYIYFIRPHGDGIKGDLHNQEGPHYQDFETCKCTYNFNCPSTGLSFVSFYQFYINHTFCLEL